MHTIRHLFSGLLLRRPIVSFLLLVASFFWIMALPPQALAQDQYLRATVSRIVSEEEIIRDQRAEYVQTIEVQLPNTQETALIKAGSAYQPLAQNKRMRVGQQIIISQQEKAPGESEWVLIDTGYRLPILGMLVGIFLALVIGIARFQGVLSIFGMGISFFVLTMFIIPQIFAGSNPVLVSVIGAMVIGAGSMYLSHGFHLKSHIAFGSIIATLTVVAFLSSVVLSFAHMSGTGSEEALFLQIDPTVTVNLQGLLLAGIVLGALGILDDICIAQVGIVTQLLAAKPSISTKELISRGLSVGKDHIASLVNTLILAYAGASLPLFLLFTLYNTQPWWVVLNSEMIAEEIVRTISGSIGLVLAVPLSTIVAALVLTRRR